MSSMIVKDLNRIIQEANTLSTLSEVLDFVVREIAQVSHADVCRMYLVDDASASYVLSASSGSNANAVLKFKAPFGEGLLGWIAKREQLLSVPDMHALDDFIAYPLLKDQALHGYLGFPVVYAGEVIGIVVLQKEADEVFSEQVQAFIITFCVQFSSLLAEMKSPHFFSKKKKSSKRKISQVWDGVPAASGVMIGPAEVIFPPADFDSVIDQGYEDFDQEVQYFQDALEQARSEIELLQNQAQASMSMAENVLFDAYLRILDSRSLSNEVEEEIKTGVWAQTALKRVVRMHMERFAGLEDEYLRERATDFKDLGQRILAHLQKKTKQTPDFLVPKILVSEEITASMLLEVPTGQLLGVVSVKGSSHSHVAILARAMGIPAVMGIDGLIVQTIKDQELVVDGYNGQVYINPNAQLKKEFKFLIAQEHDFNRLLEEIQDLPAETTDGHRVTLMVNTGLAQDTGLSLRIGAEGVGLYRTEMPFMLHDLFPSEEKQQLMYRQLLGAFSPLPVVMRTLDVGGDKPLSYFPVDEENPFLGWRGVRISLDHPELFMIQVRAMLLASQAHPNLKILLPMIGSIAEVEASQAMIQQVYLQLTAEGIDISLPPVGVMIEVPSAVFQAYELASRVDFISVGSNDLIQYMLAVDRNNARVSTLYDGLHPAVLRALKQVADATKKANKPLSICGEMASDPLAVPLLIAMGYQVLSVNARSLLRVKWVVRKFGLENSKELLKLALKMDDSREVRCAMEFALEELELGGLIRAGA